MALGDVYRLTMQSLSQNQVYINTYAFRTKTAAQPTQADAQFLADNTMAISRAQQLNVVTWTTWELKELWGEGVTTVRDECRREGGNVYIGSFSEPNDGAISSGEMLPPQCALVFTVMSGLAGRRRRGRSYLFGFTETVQTGGTWNTTFLTNMTTFLTTWYSKFGPAGTDPNFEIGVWSERTASGCIPNPNAKGIINVETPRPELAFTPSTGFNLRPTVYTQRRRTLGVGR